MKKSILFLFLVCLLIVTAACSQKTPTNASATGQSGGGTPTATPAGGNNQNSAKPSNNSDKKPEFTLKFAHTVSEDNITHKVATKWKEDIEKNSNGRIKVEIYPNGQLGADREIIESIQRGELSASLPSTAPLVNFTKTLGIFDLPFLFPTLDTVFKTFDTQTALDLLPDLNKAGIEGFAYVTPGFRELTSSKPVKKLEDLKGFKIRVQENKYHIALWKALGANPTPMAFSEVYTALEQKMINGQENAFELVYTQKLYEVQKYSTETNHIATVSVFIFSKKQYDAMPDDLKKVVKDAAISASKFSRDIATANHTKMMDNLKKAGQEIYTLDDAERKRFQEAAKPVWDIISSELGKDLVDKISGEVAKLK